MKPVKADVSFAQIEKSILDFWRENKIFERSMAEDAPKAYSGTEKEEARTPYVFYDGPPFATGLPHYGHLLAGTIKDVVGRFFTMKGYHVDRRFGWDCHGMPVEFEIQKTLDLHGAKAIREFGVDRFNEECRKIVLRYTKEWERFVERSGRWVDFSRQYRTMDLQFMESIWWAVKSLWERDLIYEGVKNVPYSWAMNTPLSNFEVNLNYKQVQDPAVTVRARIIGDVASHLGLNSLPDVAINAWIWTTTPWTLPSNMALAVGSEMSYSLVYSEKNAEIAIVASDLSDTLFLELNNEDSGVEVLAKVSGSDLEGLEYKPFFEYFEAERANNAFRIYTADFVTADEGTGVVHCASFGEEDLALFLSKGLTVVDPVDEDGCFTDEVPELAGLQVKEADSKIISMLKEKQLMVKHMTIEHSYPFCWRTETPLIYKSISTWFVKVEKLRDELLANNSEIHWVPEHIRDGRFGNWLANARDWAISRNRFWGTPIPIWRCGKCGHRYCVGSVAELEELTKTKLEDIHSHFIDSLSFSCSECGNEMHRVPEVLDCWFESGSMPYAQAHYPFESKEEFEDNFPADFIAEGLDQTRGWFYTLLVLSTALFGRPAFKNVIVNGIVLAEDGKKMSKSLKNYPSPDKVMEEFGADSMRLYLLSSPATRADDLRFSEAGVRQIVRQTLLPLWNAYNFLVTYALVDNWSPEQSQSEASQNLLDRWILSKAGSLIEGVDYALSSYHLYAALPPILDFVDQLTNWYIRLNRRRFWAGNAEAEREDKFHAYTTLHRVLLAFTRVMAPLAPFISEEIFKNLSQGVQGICPDSVHLNPYPRLSELGGATVQPELEQAMELFEEIILLARNVRNNHGLKVRQPLAKLTVVYPDADVLERIKLLDGYIKDEINIKEVEYVSDEEQFVSLKAQLNTKKLGSVLGPKLGSKGMNSLRKSIVSLSTEKIRAVEAGETIELEGETLGVDDLVIKRDVKPGIKAAASSGQITIALDIMLTSELRREGLARDFVNRVQKLRKELDFEVSDRIVIKYMTACPHILGALDVHKDYVMEETLAVALESVTTEDEIKPKSPGEPNPEPQEIEGKAVIIALSRIQG